MQIEQVELNSVQLDPNNKRLRTDENYMALRESLKRFGQQIPIVVREDNTIVKGNGTWLVAKELGWETIWIHRTVLNGREADLYAVADNRIAELSEWDYEQLSIAMQSDATLADELQTLGWTKQLLAPLRIAEWKPDVPIEKLELPPPDPFLEPSLFPEIPESAMPVFAEAMAKWRLNHPSAADQDDNACLLALLKWYIRAKEELS